MDCLGLGVREKVDGRIAAALHFGQVVRPISIRAGEASTVAPDIATQHPAAFRPRRYIAGIIQKKKGEVR
jgi:hypothetical protein